VSRFRFALTLLATAFVVAPLHAGPGLFKKKTDPARVSTLIETLKSDPDEKKRKSAADELGGADSRLNPEVAAVLVVALQKDPSAAVRMEAAESLGQLGQVFPVAGQTLESAAMNDSSPLVRLAAKRALWEYHLGGYRSPKGADGVATQTIEPPIASPTGPRPVVAFVPAPAPPVVTPTPVAPLVPQLPPASAPSGSQWPTIAITGPGPRIFRHSVFADLFPGSRLVNRPANPAAPPSMLNATNEPPRAKRPPVTIPPFPEPSWAPPPTLTVVPKPLPPLPRPDYVPTLPPFQPDLPSVVLPPDVEDPKAEPPALPKIPPTLPPIEGSKT
jgi:hypothetical protein